MEPINIEMLLKPISDDSPCGEDLSDLTDFYILEDYVKGKEETQFEKAQPPEWNNALELAQKLLGQGKELWAVVYLIHALVALDGPQGLNSGLKLLNQMLQTYWDGIYPQLDDDDDNPAMERMNILSYLSAPGGLFIEKIKEMPICNSRQLGTYSYRHVLLASGEITPTENDKTPDMGLIEAAMKDSDPEYMAELQQTLKDAIDTIKDTNAFLNEISEPDNTAQLGQLEDILRRIAKQIDAGINMEGAGFQPDDDEKAGTPQPADAPRRKIGAIADRDDVIIIFEKICAWYYENEPSSPVPLFLERARNLVGKNFREIITDVANKAEAQLTELVGPAGTYDGPLDKMSSANSGKKSRDQKKKAAKFNEINDYNDIRTALDMVHNWYKNYEISSPIPLFVIRAKNLVGKSFLDIINDVANKAAPQVTELKGEK